ncbi:response regulator [Candidatus Omnitrophota bacterium]
MGRKKVLVIDDEENFTKLIKLNLEATGGFEVKTENNGLNAFAAAKRFKPDVVLLDIKMPEKNGGEVAFEIKNDSELKDTPVIFITALISDQDVESRNGFIGGHHYIAKPVKTQKLIDIIELSIRERG